MYDNLQTLVIVTHIWQKLSNVEHSVIIIVTHFWQLFSEIFSETLLIVTHFWQSHISFHIFAYPLCSLSSVLVSIDNYLLCYA